MFESPARDTFFQRGPNMKLQNPASGCTKTEIKCWRTTDDRHTSFIMKTDVFTTCFPNIQEYILQPITKTSLNVYNFDPLKPHFYIVKLGFTGVYIIFLILSKKNIETLKPPRPSGSKKYPQSMFWEEIWKYIRLFFLSEKLILVVKFSVYLNRRIFVMPELYFIILCFRHKPYQYQSAVRCNVLHKIALYFDRYQCLSAAVSTHY